MGREEKKQKEREREKGVGDWLGWPSPGFVSSLLGEKSGQS